MDAELQRRLGAISKGRAQLAKTRVEQRRRKSARTTMAPEVRRAAATMASEAETVQIVCAREDTTTQQQCDETSAQQLRHCVADSPAAARKEARPPFTSYA